MVSKEGTPTPETSDIPAEIAQRYSRSTALRHERLYGRGYQGPASEDVFRSLAERLTIAPGMSVLDVGSGLGGDAFRLANMFGVSVLGLDASADMVEIARERTLTDTQDPRFVSFVVGNVLRSPAVAEKKFDVVWSRDAGAFLRGKEKAEAWRRLRTSLRENGQVLITDYCVGQHPDPGFRDRMAQWGQHMVTIEEYAGVLREAGFEDVMTEDRTDDLSASQRDGLERLERDRTAIVDDFGTGAYATLKDRWEQKLEHSTTGNLAWMVLTARRGVS